VLVRDSELPAAAAGLARSVNHLGSVAQKSLTTSQVA